MHNYNSVLALQRFFRDDADLLLCMYAIVRKIGMLCRHAI